MPSPALSSPGLSYLPRLVLSSIVVTGDISQRAAALFRNVILYLASMFAWTKLRTVPARSSNKSHSFPGAWWSQPQ